MKREEKVNPVKILNDYKNITLEYGILQLLRERKPKVEKTPLTVLQKITIFIKRKINLC